MTQSNACVRLFSPSSGVPRLRAYYTDFGRDARRRCRRRPLADRTIEQDLVAIANFCRLMGDLPVDRIAQAEMDGFAAAREAEHRGRGPGGEVSPNTIRKDLVHLRSVLKTAKAAGLVAAVPALPPIEPADPRQIDAWSLEEVGLVLSALAGHRGLRCLAVFLYNTGLRIGSAMRATWDLVDREEPGWLFLPRGIMKGGKHDHRVYLNAWARRAIEEVRGNDLRLFAFWRWPSSKSWLCTKFRSLVRSSGLPRHRWFAFHAFRAACYNAVGAIDPVAAELVLGHRTTIGLRHYADRYRMVGPLARLPQPQAIRQRALF